jgi:hypothetical protein
MVGRGNGLTVTTTVIGVPIIPFTVGVTVYVTIASEEVLLVRVWEIIGPVPLENPEAVPPVRAAVQAKVVVPILLDNEILVEVPLHKFCEDGVAITPGLSFTVTKTSCGCPIHPPLFLSTTDKV